MILIILLLIVCAFFTASEIAFVSCDLVKLRHWASKNRKGAKFALNSLKNIDKFLAAILVGTNLTIIGLGVTASKVWCARLPEAVIVLFVALITFIFGEVLPKSIASRFKEQFTILFARLYTIIYWIFYPLIFVTYQTAISILRYFKARTRPPFHRFTKEELQIAAKSALSLEEQNFISRLLQFRVETVKDIMVPRNMIQAASVDLSISELRQIVSKSGYSRIPIYQGSIDEIIGVIEAKELLTANYVRDILKPCRFILETELIELLFSELRVTDSFFAIVRDEHGKTVGLVTMEDILEELFGEIEDEYDKIEPTPIFLPT
ncbi:MAG: hemolysin family protein [bacterium]|nr:hemolysin family protein [bacterium]